jgi:hypothetical protein
MSSRMVPFVVLITAVAVTTTRASDLAAQVATIDVQPTSIAGLAVGEQREVVATALDARSQLIFDASFRWVATDPTIVSVEPDPAVAGLALITGLAPGVSTIEVRVGNATKAIAVSVTGGPPRQQLPPLRPVRRDMLTDTVMAGGVAERAANLTAQVRSSPFQTPPGCGSAFFVGDDGLVLTTYQAIRGADRLEVELVGQTITDVQVVAYSVPNDLAVLRLPNVNNSDSLLPAPRVVEQTIVWGFGYPECGDLTRTRLRIERQQTVAGRPIVRLSDPLTTEERGAPLLTRQGDVMAIAAGDATAVPGPQAADLIAEARANVRLRTLLTAQDVARREQHRHGTLIISSGVTGTVARVRPLDPWHWEGLATEGATPFTFTGPMGRYRVELVQDGQVRGSAEVVVSAGELRSVTLRVSEETQPVEGQPEQVSGRATSGGFPVALVLLGVAGAGAGAFLLMGGGDDGGTQTDLGRITVTVPNP